MKVCKYFQITHKLFFNYRWILAIGAIAGYFLPYLILGEDAYFTIHDNLDSNLTWYKALADSGTALSFSNDIVVPNIMNGIPRNAMPRALNIITLLFMAFSPLKAYLINFILVHIIGFLGMYFLLKKYIFITPALDLLCIGVALCFMSLPFGVLYGGATVSGLPFVNLSLFNLYKRKYFHYNYLILFLFPFYSSFVISGIFVLVIAGSVYLINIILKKNFNLRFLLGLFILFISYLLVENNLLRLLLFNETFISHRIEFLIPVNNFKESLSQAINHFKHGQYHSQAFHQIIIGCIAVCLFISFMNRIPIKPLLKLLSLIVTISFIAGFWNWQKLLYIKQHLFLNVIDLSRFTIIDPLLWYLSFALCLCIFVVANNKRGLFLAYFLVIVQFIFIITQNMEFRKNISIALGNNPSEPSFKEFYSEKLFEEIESHIGEPKSSYRVASLGFFPNIALYNGYYTLDSYQPNYSLKYKHEFRKIIEKELDKSSYFESYFDNWGSRCYLFAAELEGFPFFISKDKEVKISNLELNIEQFKKMGGKYLFSAVEILNYSESELQLLNVFENNSSPLKIYVYKAK